MYMVVSRWRAKPGKEEEFRAKGLKMRAFLKSLPEVQLIEHFVAESGDAVVAVGYSDDAAYNRIINDPNGPFARAAQENDLENIGEWISSDRGYTE